MEIENTASAEEMSSRLAVVEMQLERSKVVMESLAGFCHALGQPAQVLLTGIELLKMGVNDTAILDSCYEAVNEIRDLLAEMKKKREYVAEAYLANKEEAGTMISLQEWRDKAPPKASWDK